MLTIFFLSVLRYLTCYFFFSKHSLGLLVGMVVSSVMMNVIKGAVNTLIVCFADAPAKLEENHPQTVRDLTATWRSVFPNAGIGPIHAYPVV